MLLPPVECFKKWPICPGGPKREYLAQLRFETREIKNHYVKFYTSFKKSYLNREKCNEVGFHDLSVVTQDLFDFDDEYIKSFESNTNKLLLEIIESQSYVNFDSLITIINAYGTKEDIEIAETYREAFKQYARRRIFECDAEVLGKELPGHETVMFILDKGPSFKLMDVDDFKVNLCRLLGIKRHKIILHKIETGSVIISILIPSKHVKSFNTLPLFHSKMLSLKEWCTRLYKLRDEVVHLSHWNVLNSIDLDSASVVHTSSTDIVPAIFEGERYLALKYTGSFSNESTADIAYIKYMDRFLSGKYKNLPAVKGVYYHQSSEEETHHYPTIVVESMTSLEEISSKEVSPVNQISLLYDISCSILSFESDQNYQVSVFPESVFVRHQESEITACFCPLYGHSYLINSPDHQKPSPSASLPLKQLQWMRDVVKLIHFQGNIAANAELPKDHILKRIFDQKWISSEDRFRPPNFKTLSEELQRLLGRFMTIMNH